MAKGMRWILARRPQGDPATADFALEEFTLEPPGKGKMNIRVEYHTIAPGIRPKLTGQTYAAMVQIGDPIPGVGVGLVEASDHPEFAVGDRVTGELGWATHTVSDGAGLRKLDKQVFDASIPSSAAVDVLGSSGLTAYFGLLRVGEARPGMTVLISSAAGAVGSAVGQFARILGCRVVGIAGSPEKSASLTDDFGFDASIDYRATPNLTAAIAANCPNGVDVYFDNVGGVVTDAAIRNMRIGGRIVICGQTSEYNLPEPRGVRAMTEVISRRLRLEGFIVYDFLEDFDAARAQIAGWLRDGRLKHLPTVIPGIEHAVDGFLARFTGAQGGRPIVQPSPP
jgi:NADPH-dependent curcumin reductase CurA